MLPSLLLSYAGLRVRRRHASLGRIAALLPAVSISASISVGQHGHLAASQSHVRGLASGAGVSAPVNGGGIDSPTACMHAPDHTDMHAAQAQASCHHLFCIASSSTAVDVCMAYMQICSPCVPLTQCQWLLLQHSKPQAPPTRCPWCCARCVTWKQGFLVATVAYLHPSHTALLPPGAASGAAHAVTWKQHVPVHNRLVPR